MIESENFSRLHHDTYEPRPFIKESLFYYKNFDQVLISGEYSDHFDTADSYYLYYVESGSMFITLNRQMFSMTKNDLLLVKKNVDVSLSTNGVQMYVIEFDGKLTADYIKEISSPNSYWVSMVDFSNIILFFIKLKELSVFEVRNEVYISYSLEAIIVEMYTKIHYGFYNEKPKNYAILKALFYIEQNINFKISLEDLSEYVGYSVYHFSRVFKDEVGVSPYGYIIQYRLNLAKHLLITTTSSIGDISKKCGYSNEINFYNSFKKYFNITPRKYRIQAEYKEK